jgi:segregation and condensation protein A
LSSTETTTSEEEQVPAGDAPVKSAEDGPIIIEGIEDEIPDEVLRLELDKFEGPFEVLLYLIKSQEIDIFDIPILKVTEQYLRFLEMMEEENLEAAGDFLVMAATLIQIKSKMILPIDVGDDEEEEEIEEEDPRLELVEKLLEYRKFRDLANALGDRSDLAQDNFARSCKPRIEKDENEETEMLEITLYDLMKAIKSILRFVVDAGYHEVELEGASVDEKIAFIQELLEGRDTLTWNELREDNGGKIHLVCCLLAILELSRMRRIRYHQHTTYGDIRIVARDPREDDGDVYVDGEEADVAAT